MCGMETHTKQREKIQSTGLNLSSIRLEELCQSRWGSAGLCEHSSTAGCGQGDARNEIHPSPPPPSKKLSLRPKRFRLGFFSSPEGTSKPWGGGERLRGRWGEMFPRAPRAPSAGIRGLRSGSAAASGTCCFEGHVSGGCGAGFLKNVLCTTAERALSNSGICPPEVFFLWLRITRESF